MRWLCGFLLAVLTLALVTPAYGWVNNSEQPGSVLVFPKFITGSVQDLDQENTGLLPRTVFKVSAVCPSGSTCPAGQLVYLKAHWVCPGDPVAHICAEQDFNLTTSVEGTILFYPNPDLNDEDSGAYTSDNDLHRGSAPGLVVPPTCHEGYLILWVVDVNGFPIKFDGLIGNAVLRSSLGNITISAATSVSNSLGSSTRSYNAITIQADSMLNTNDFTDLVVNPDGTTMHTGTLQFDDSGSHYVAVTGTVFAPLRYADAPDNPSQGTEDTRLVFLTLDVQSNLMNLMTDVALNFYAQDQTLGGSTATHFVCWGEVELNNTGLNKTEDIVGSEYGLVQSTGASQSGKGVSLIGLVESRETLTQTVSIPNVASANATIRKDYAYLMFNDGQPVITTFTPF